jgi:oligopeptide transport system substrate-binding protein
MREGKYDLGLTRWGPDYADPMTYLDMWITGAANNSGKWSNADYDAIIKSAKDGELSLDPVKRWAALQKAEGMVMDDAAILPVYQKYNAVMIKKNVSDLQFHSVGIGRVMKIVTKN